jgi:hypothetical protein
VTRRIPRICFLILSCLLPSAHTLAVEKPTTKPKESAARNSPPKVTLEATQARRVDPETKTATARELIRAGYRAMQAKDFDKARKCAWQAEDLKPDLEWWEMNPVKLLEDIDERSIKDTAGKLEVRKRGPRRLSPQELDALWTRLQGDAATAHQSILTLLSAPADAVPFLANRLHPSAGVDQRRVAVLIKQLDSNRFAERQKAQAELRNLANGAESILRKALAENPAAEVRRRLEQVLQPLDPTSPSGERRRTLRAVEILERIGNVEAKRVLRHLAEGDSMAWLTIEAAASLRRLAK